MQRVDLRLRGRGHDARQILRVGKKREDEREREGNPVGEFEVVGHWVIAWCLRLVGKAKARWHAGSWGRHEILRDFFAPILG